MADEIAIRLTNLAQIRAAFNQAPSLMRRELNLAIRKTILNIQAKEVLEYRSLGIGIITRGLIGSITRGTYYGDLMGEVGPNVTGSPGVSYSVYVHNGTRFMQKRPFLLYAVRDAEHDTGDYFEEAVNNVLGKIGALV